MPKKSKSDTDVIFDTMPEGYTDEMLLKLEKEATLKVKKIDSR